MEKFHLGTGGKGGPSGGRGLTEPNLERNFSAKKTKLDPDTGLSFCHPGAQENGLTFERT